MATGENCESLDGWKSIDIQQINYIFEYLK